MAESKHPSQRRYPRELRDRAVRMVQEARGRDGDGKVVVSRIAQQLGVGYESLRKWVLQAELDQGRRPGTTTEEQRRIAELERKVRELRRANETLKAGIPILRVVTTDGYEPPLAAIIKWAHDHLWPIPAE